MSVKVAVRVRPFNPREKERDPVCCIKMVGNTTIMFDELGGKKEFAFDHSFWSHDGFEEDENGYYYPADSIYADQKLVFDTLGKEILDNAWEGYNCCLFAYGQTGSGKSYSMVGYKSNKGIVPISCNEIFQRIDATKGPHKQYEVSVSMLEIYNEKVQDLLIPINDRPSAGLKIRESKTVGVFVENLTKYPVQTYEEIEKKMDESYQNRTIGSTLMNATSSRAHTIVTIEFKQRTGEGKLASERISNINLVDLAGSERSSSTGATGDRLKEGCNINKSLLILGNVINALADKAMGKSSIKPPYRDSALTRILQNALGGNSKTVMICALSPALLNYEETLSTLRYADRAKKIQNKAIINESEQDKMVRQLKEENLDLKRMIEDLNKKIIGGGGVIEEKDKLEFLNLKEQYEANNSVMIEMQKTFEEKLLEAKKYEKEHTLGEKIDLTKPHLVVLNEDPQLSHKLKYGLVNLPVYVGRKLGNPTPQICLSGIGIKLNHAVFLYDEIKKGMILKPKDPEAREHIYINGKRLNGYDGQLLSNKDRITFGTNSIMVYQEEKDSGKDIDWELAQNELQQEIENYNKFLEEESKKRKLEEMENYKKNLEEKYIKDRQDIEEKMKKQHSLYEDKLKEMNQSAERGMIENDRKNMELIMQEKLKVLEQEKVRKKREIEMKQKQDLNKKQEQIKQREIIHKSEKLEQNLHNVMKKINKMKIIIQELKRNVNLDIFISKDITDHLNTLDQISGKSNASVVIKIRVENFEEGSVYYWNLETFQNRYDMMKQILDKIQNDDLFDIDNLSKEDDPLWDEHKPTLIGYAFYKIEGLAFLINNPVTCIIVSSSGETCGNLTVDIIPYDDDGNEFDDVPDDVNELIGIPVNFKVYIKEANDLPVDHCRGTYVEYSYLEYNLLYSSKIIEQKTRNPVFEEFIDHRIDFLTRDDIEFFTKEMVSFFLSFALEFMDLRMFQLKEN